MAKILDNGMLNDGKNRLESALRKVLQNKDAALESQEVVGAVEMIEKRLVLKKKLTSIFRFKDVSTIESRI